MTASAAAPVELRLYVSASSESSMVALRNVTAILSDYDARAVTLTVHDLYADPSCGEADRITFTPTLVKRSPEPRMWIVGDLRNSQVLSDLLNMCGVKPAR